MLKKAIELLLLTKQYPRMFASDKESLMCRVSTILEMAEISFNINDFYEKHLKVYGNIYADIKDQYDDSWAESVIDDALYIIKGIK